MAYQAQMIIDNGLEIPSLQNISEQSVTQKYPLGALLKLNDGRVFRYAGNSSAGALAAGQLCQRAAPVANHLNMACAVTALAAKAVTVTDGGTAFTANQYAEGFLHINGDIGEGHIYKVKSHPANAGSATCVITLYDEIRVALDATSDVTLTKNKYKDLIVCPTTLTAPPAGWSTIVVTASYFFWMLVKGTCVALQHTGSSGAAAVGNCVVPASTNTPVAGAVEEFSSGLIPIVGVVEQVNATTEYGLISACIQGE